MVYIKYTVAFFTMLKVQKKYTKKKKNSTFFCTFAFLLHQSIVRYWAQAAKSYVQMCYATFPARCNA
jgi:hypothetical protein